MNVSELIEKLGQYDGSMVVLVKCEGCISDFDVKDLSVSETMWGDKETQLVIDLDGGL